VSVVTVLALKVHEELLVGNELQLDEFVRLPSTGLVFHVNASAENSGCNVIRQTTEATTNQNLTEIREILEYLDLVLGKIGKREMFKSGLKSYPCHLIASIFQYGL
jgi:hypothetical protein